MSVHGFQCQRPKRFMHGRVIFLGDAAHVVSPFGVRGGKAPPVLRRGFAPAAADQAQPPP
ncbi:hypothetical protein ACFW16_04600 [Inquilinus sp. NPDC058860]|uniref:hypothetical protein n=1 Tax=Inquilinus sp. NPDC058860 TaxID=3346652 RepID=UPI0036A08D26